MPLLLTGGVELLEPQAVSTELQESTRTEAMRVPRAGCEDFPDLLFEVGVIPRFSSVATCQYPTMTDLRLHLRAQGHDELGVVRTGSVQLLLQDRKSTRL